MLIANDSIDIMDRDIGIYKIYCKENNMVYIGQSNQINQRWKSHRNDLINNKHHNNLLQEDFNKFGELAFDFEIIHLAEVETLNMLEGFYMELYKDRSYNIKNANGTKNIIDKELSAEEFVLLKKFKSEININLDSIRNYIMLLDFIGSEYKIVDIENIFKIARKKKYSDRFYSDFECEVIEEYYNGYTSTEKLLRAKIYSIFVLANGCILKEIVAEKTEYSNLVKIRVNYYKSKLREGRLVLNCTILKTDEKFEKVLYF